MPAMEKYSEYDRLAWFYDRYWGERYHGEALAVIENLLSVRIPPGARILDLCCGTGHLTRVLAARGYSVTGIDGSEEMLAFARANAPECEFFAMDARSFSLPARFHAVVSTFDSLNHVMRIEELVQVFRNAHDVLVDEGTLFFDLNMEEAYTTMWGKSSAIVEPDNVCVVRGGFDTARKIGRTDITMFQLLHGESGEAGEHRELEEQGSTQSSERDTEHGKWRRSDVTLFQKCHAPGDVERALREAGFAECASFDARRDLGMTGDIMIGRTFFLAGKTGAPAAHPMKA